MVTDGVVASTCEFCMMGCGVLVYLRDGKPVRVEGDPDYPVNKGVLCPIGMASLEYLYHPDRLKHPLKRAGKRGSGKWQRISWDEALDTIAAELTKTKEKYGAESIVFIRGGAKGYQDNYLARFANVFGTPNVPSTAPICHVPRVRASEITCGFMPNPDYEYPPACIVMWGVNAYATAIANSKREIAALQKGSKLVVIDPAETEYTRRSDIWVRVRPSSDLALALGMINVIINEKLYDGDFVDRWTVGFDQLEAHVQDYPPGKVGEITWVPAETITEAARVYATSKPACIAWGNGIDTNIDNFQCARAISILRAITGNIGRPGGDVQWSPSGIVPRGSPDLVQQDALPADMRTKWISARDGILPTVSYALPQTIVKAMIEADPYPVRAAYIPGGSLLHTYSNAQETRRALESLDFLVVSDFFMTPTAELADIVLPVATYLETDSLLESLYSSTVGVIQKVAQIGECWSDYRIWKELAQRLGLGDYFWDDERGFLDYLLKPAGLTFDEFRKVRVISGSKQYRNYERNGFKTPSGKVELYSDRLKEWGFDPLPLYREPLESPYSEPELAKEYPLVFTNHKLAYYKHSAGRQIATLRGSHPEPLVTIHTETAGKLGIAEGDWVYIETKRGRIKQKATLTPNIDPRVVMVDYGWWFPEKEDSELHGWAESNINVLTDNKQPYGREMGTATLKGILCKIYKAF